MNFDTLRLGMRARLFVLLNQTSRAIDAYTQLLRFDGRSPRTLNTLACLCVGEKRFPEAEQYFAEALEREPGNAEARFNLGFVREHLGRHEEAIEAFCEAVRLKPSIDRAWYGMGLCYAAQGRHDEAARALQKAAELQPMNPYAWYNLGMAYHALNDPDQVKAVIERLSGFDPKMTRKLVQDAGRADLSHLLRA